MVVASNWLTGALAAERRSGANTRTYDHATPTHVAKSSATTAHATSRARAGGCAFTPASSVAESVMARLQQPHELYRALVEEEPVSVERDVQRVPAQRGRKDADRG